MSSWTELYDESSERNYYCNAETNEVSWEKPAELLASEVNALPPGWTELYDEGSGRNYYVNEGTGETSWDRPVSSDASANAPVPTEASEEAQSSQWVEAADDSGAVYYYNTATGETSWEKPTESPVPPSSGTGSPKQSEWEERVDPSSNRVYYVNTVTNETQWENPFASASPQSSRDRLDSATSALSTNDAYSLGEPDMYSPNQRGSLQRSGSGLGSAGPGTPTQGYNSPRQQRDSLTPANPALAGTSNCAAAADSSLGKNMTLFGKTELNLPAFVTDTGADGTGKSQRSKNSSKQARQQDYSSAPGEFLADYLAAKTPTVAPARRRSSAGGMNAAVAAAAVASMAAGVAGDGTAGAAAALQGLALDTADDEDDVDLTPEELAALDTLDLIDASTTALKASEILLSVDAQALQSPYVLSHMTKKLASFTLDKYADAHFQYDRRATSNSSTLHAHPVEKLLTYQSELLKAPLTALSTAAMSADAVACFRLISAFLDNSKSSGLQQIDLAMNLLLKLITAPSEFHDEIYCQICKQTRKNPTSEGLEFGWQLMLLCLATVPPSKRLLPYLCNYFSTSMLRLEAGAAASRSAVNANLPAPADPTSTGTVAPPAPPSPALAAASSAGSRGSASASDASAANAMKFVLIALRTVVPAAGAAVRTEIPTRAEIRALLLGESLDVSVTTMVAGTFHTFSVNSFTTVEKVLQMMCDTLQIHEVNRRIFTLYEVSTEEEVQAGGAFHAHAHSPAHPHSPSVEVELNLHERVLDWVGRCQRAQLYHQSAQHAHTHSVDERDHSAHRGIANPHAVGALDVHGSPLHGGTTHTYKLLFKAKYIFRMTEHCGDPVTMELLYAQCLHDVLTARYLHTPADAIVLAAFVLQELCGDYHAGTRTLGELKVKSITLSKLIARSILEQNIINKHEIEGRIFTAYKALAGTSKEQARRQYLSYISCWKIFGATFFIVSGQVNNFTEIVLSVSVNSILLVDPASMQYLAEYKYSDIYSWGHSFDSFVLIIGSKTSQSKSYFKTAQGKEIDGLVRLYHEHHVHTGSGSGGAGSGVEGVHGSGAHGKGSAHHGKGAVSFSTAAQ